MAASATLSFCRLPALARLPLADKAADLAALALVSFRILGMMLSPKGQSNSQLQNKRNASVFTVILGWFGGYVLNLFSEGTFFVLLTVRSVPFCFFFNGANLFPLFQFHIGFDSTPADFHMLSTFLFLTLNRIPPVGMERTTRSSFTREDFLPASKLREENSKAQGF